MATHIGDVSFYMGPHTIHPALDNLEQVIVDFIDGAQKRLVIAIQELESKPIAEAILRAEIERKVQIKVVLEADYLASKKRPKTVEEAFDMKGQQSRNGVYSANANFSFVHFQIDSTVSQNQILEKATWRGRLRPGSPDFNAYR